MLRKLLIGGSALFILSSGATFAMSGKYKCPLNTVSFQLQSEQWISTHTAKVIVQFSGSLTEKGLAQVHQHIQDKLAKLYKETDWHITQFQRQKDNSGLENVIALAEARLPESALPGLRKQAKAISQPGSTYQIAQIQFVPSQLDVQVAQANLRQNIYRKVKIELAHLNKLYPDQHYEVHKIQFSGQPAVQFERSRIAGAVNFMKMPKAAPMKVSNKLKIQANVEFAAQMSEKEKNNV